MLRTRTLVAITTVLAGTASAQDSPRYGRDKFRQLDQELPTPNEQRTASGAPGHAYWQMKADYDIHVEITEPIADGSGAYPGTEAITTAIGSLWGTTTALPRWPESAGEPTSAWTLPGTFVQAGKHDPSIVFSSINTAYDETQTDFVKKVGLPTDDIGKMIDDNTALIESKGVKVHSWVGPGTLHTILTRPQFYSDTVEGTSIRDWVADLITGKDAPDVHCKDCKKPA